MRRVFPIVFGVCAVLALSSLWIGRYLPMVDLPQHAAQISIINNFDRPEFRFAEQFELDWFVPYSMGYFLSAQLALLVGIFSSLKATVSLAVLALPASLYVLLRETEGDPWWSLIGFPFAYGFAFYWGFMSYIMAVPVGVMFVAIVYRHCRFPTLRSGIFVVLWAVLLFFSHAIAFAACGAAAGIVALSSREKIKTLLPLLIPIPFVLLWMHAPVHDVPKVTSIVEFGSRPWERLVPMFFDLVCNAHHWMAGAFSLALFCAVLIGSKLKRPSWSYHGPFLVILVLYLAVPHHAMDISFIYQRLVVFVPVFFLGCLAPIDSVRRRVASRALVSILVMGWLVTLIFQFRGFNLEARDFDSVVDQLKPGKNAMGVIFDNGGGQFFLGSYGHFPAYYQALKGGGLSFSFAHSYKSVARFRSGSARLPYIGPAELSRPLGVRMREARQFDYFIVRSLRDRTADLRIALQDYYSLVAHRGAWWVYETKE